MNKTEYTQYLKSPKWKQLRARIRMSVFYCQACASKENLNVHHRTYERVGNEDTQDLRVLCSFCHEDLHEKYTKAHGKIDSEKLRLFTLRYMKKGRRKYRDRFLVIWAAKKKLAINRRNAY